MKVGLIITAAGVGSRFSKVEKKQFVSINGLPLLVHTCRAFLNIDCISEYIVTCNNLKEMRAMLDQHGLVQFKACLGGYTRQESVKKGVEAISNCDAVMIHDAARPNISEHLINQLISQFVEEGIIPGLPVTDTVKQVKNGFVEKTISRDVLWTVQTPQLFSYTALEKAYKTASQSHTDESGLLEALGEPVKLVNGDPKNIKITTPADLDTLKSWWNCE